MTIFRYRVSVVATDPTTAHSTENAATVELVFFGPRAEEIVGTPVDALIRSDAGIGGFLPRALTNLYGRCFQLHLSVSPLCLQSPNIIYQVDSIVGVANLPPPTPTLLRNCVYIESHLCLLFSQCLFYSYNY